ncbi:NUDIX hydrolase [Planococcus donghaensis]|uniref:Phosphohydrolase n=1 Tax=Planococcus donghaensis TaxID=414778 RepID=A0A1C7EGZ2_9BACL|nr:NUDIX hydrolase [Planococcus donghaensis]ANU23120.1 phosphohydrolase [Planococcus donghaensis]
MTKASKSWIGAAGIVVLDNKILMVKEKATKRWSVPSGEIENGETVEQACIREIQEETGFSVSVGKAIHTKNMVIGNFNVTTYYFYCTISTGEIINTDPDDEIEEIAWQNYDNLLAIEHDYPEDLELLLSFVTAPNCIEGRNKHVL